MTRADLIEAALAEEDTNKLRVLRELFEMESSKVRSYYDEIISASRTIESLQKTITNADSPASKQVTETRAEISEMRAIIKDRISKIKVS